MQMTFVNRVATCAAVFVSLMSLNSCVNEQYEISQERLDLNVTVFQEGLCLPLGTTERIRLDSIINKLGLEEEIGKYISTENGAYSFFYRPEQPLDMSEQLASINGILDIDAVDFSKKVDVSLENVDMSDISYSGNTYPMEHRLSESFAGINVHIDPIEEHFGIDANIRQYTGDIGEIEVPIGFGEQSGTFEYASVPGNLVIPDELLADETVRNAERSISDINGLLGTNIELAEIIDNTSLDTHIEFAFNEYVKSVEDVHIKEGARMKVTVTMLNTCFTSGSITPHVEMDLHELFHLSYPDGTPLDKDEIKEDFTLTHDAENNWSTSKEYLVKGLIIDKSKDLETAPNDEGKEVLWLKKHLNVSVGGYLEGNTLKTTLATLAQWLDEHDTPESRNVMVKVDVSFEDLFIDDITAELNPIPFEMHEETTFDIDIPALTFPEEVRAVKNVIFSEDSAINVELSAKNLSSIGEELDFLINDMSVTFPDILIIEGADDDNTVVIPGADLSDGTHIHQIKVTGIKIGAIDESGCVPAYKGTVRVAPTSGSVSGKIHTDHLPKIEDDDLFLIGDVVANLKVEDYTLVLKDYTISDQTHPDLFKKETITIEIPEELAGIEGLAVYPKGNPEIELTMETPEISTKIAPTSADGLRIYLPEMLVLKKGGYPYEDWFDDVSHAIVFPYGEVLPSEITLPVDRLVVTAQKDDEGKYYCSGEFKVTGAVGVEDGAEMTKADVDLLSMPDARISFVAEIPALEPDNVSMTSYHTDIERQTISFNPLEGVELPEMLKRIGDVELDNVYLTLSVETGEGFPSIGEDAELSVGVTVTLPDCIVVDDPRFEDGSLSLNGTLEKIPGGSAMRLAVDPIKVSGLALDKDSENLTEPYDIVIDGGVNLSGVSLNVDEWVGKTHSIDIAASLATVRDGVATDKLGISKATGVVDYQLEPISTNIDLSSIKEVIEGEEMDVVADIETFFVTADLVTNLGVPVKADVSLIPYYGNEPGTPITEELVIEGSSSASESKTTRIYLSNKAPVDPQAYDKYIELDLVSLLYKDEARTQLLDSIKVELNAGTDAQKTCVFEPSEEYTLTVDYSAGIPVAFGEDFEFTYRYVMELPEEAAMIMEYGSLALCGEVESSLPIGLNLTARLLDSDNEPLNVSDRNIEMEIRSSDASGNPTKSQIDLMISNDNKIDISDLKSVELVFTADAEMAPGVQFREDNYIRAVLYALIPEGVSLDAAELLEKDEEDNE